ncbi:MAG: glycosyltransferase family 2 protein [Verrucomicrobiales bacterium]|nr:glycosyltransferase family 2 protein [Verrucomicrobiales bacterium]
MNPFLRKRISRRPMPPRVNPASHLNPGTRVPVAIIVIGHNGAAFLGECLASVFAQTVTPDEIQYVDDASTDDSLEVARSFADRGLQIVALPENVGMNAARMAGFDRSTAPLLLFVDGDNVLPPDYLAIMAAELAARPDAAFTCPGKRFIGDPGAVAWRKKWPSDFT